MTQAQFIYTELISRAQLDINSFDSCVFSAQFSVCVSTPTGAFNYTTSSENKFVTYENSTEGTKIDYPKGWTVIRQYGLAFLSPKENDSDTFREGLVVARISCK